MKYLQLYNHLGNLVKEFEVYVDGKDFDWAAQKPEPVWLGTIRLSNEKAAVPVEPTPEVPTPTEVFPKQFTEMEVTYGEKPEPIDEGELAFQKVEAEARLEEIEEQQEAIEVEEEQEKGAKPPFTTQPTTIETQPESEVKHEPEKRSHKSRRAKGTGSSARSKRA